VDPRLRAAVDTSLAWYRELFALHAIPTQVDDGLWWSLGPPPPWHSGVKTTEPNVGVDRVLAVHRCGTVADSFGDVDLAPFGFTVLLDAVWALHPPLEEPPTPGLPHGWTVVLDTGLLAQWSRAHDYAGVLLPAVLDRPSFTVLARHHNGALAGGAVVHHSGRPGVVGLSNSWSATSTEVDHAEVLAVVGALHPGSSVTGFAEGADLDAMVAAGYTALGPQRVWVPSHLKGP
jgi:hypothetical protein